MICSARVGRFDASMDDSQVGVTLPCLDMSVSEMVGPDPFAGLDLEAVGWAGLTHAYGSASDVPALIRSLVAPDADERSKALQGLFSAIYHQGTVYRASAPAVPFLARALITAPDQRALIGQLIAGMSRQYGEDWSDPSTLSGAVRAQVAAVVGELAPLLADPDPGIRQAMLRLIAVCPSPVVRELCDLRGFDDEDGHVRADALLALARVEPDWPRLRPRLEESLHDDSPAVRQAAALIVLSLDGLPFSQATTTVLADSISAVGDLWAEPHDESWDRLPRSPLRDPPEDRVGAGRDSLGVLTTLTLDPDAALEAAARIVAAPTRHAVQGVHLAEQVYDYWRDRDEAVAAVLATYLAIAADITYPSVRLCELAGCASRIEAPDPGLATAVLPWAEHGDGKIASAAVGALARLRHERCLELAESALARRMLGGSGLLAVCEVYSEQAATLLPHLRQQLTEQSTQPPPPGTGDPLAEVVQVLPLLGAGALSTVPDLLGLLQAGRCVRSALQALTRFGPAALAAPGSRDAAVLIEGASAAGSAPDRLFAAVALREVAGDDSCARRLAAELASRPDWGNHTVAQLGLLGPAAAAYAPRIAPGLDSAGPWTAVRAAEAYWKITGQTEPCADVLARHVSAKPPGFTAVATLLAMSRLPAQCLPMVRHLADAPRGLAFDGFQNGAAHADDVMRDNARALLRLQPT